MNVNEVLANRALELLGHSPGEYRHCHPNDHVNRSQSTNDVYPTAMRIALIFRSVDVERAATRLEQALRGFARDHDRTSKLGRTQLQDAVGMSVGDEFDAWADAVATARALLVCQRDALLEVNLGGTAIGTGLTASDPYRDRVIPLLCEVTGLSLRRAVRHVSATTDSTSLLGYSGALRSCAIALAKIANDLRLLSSGPNGGFGELLLPPVQSGSSMMPGKVNPVIPEYVNQLCFRIHGLDLTTTLALDAAQLQLGAMLPAAAASLFEAQDCLRVACEALTDRCVRGITIDEERLNRYATAGLGELTEAVAVLGYEESSRLVRDAERAAHVTDRGGSPRADGRR
jgi:aspartate ammonia-lyase